MGTSERPAMRPAVTTQDGARVEWCHISRLGRQTWRVKVGDVLLDVRVDRNGYPNRVQVTVDDREVEK